LAFRVKTAGYYRLGFRYKQNAVINGESWRWLKIDGETPFKEAKTLRFPYDPQWSFYEFSAEDGQPYYLWLDAGEHELSLEVTLGEMAVYYERLSRIVQQLGDECIEIVKITGGTPDYNRDYELFRQIPDFNETLAACSDALATLVQDMQDFTGKRGNQYIAAMNNMKRVLDIMVERPYTAQHYVKDYYNNYSSLSSWSLRYEIDAAFHRLDTAGTGRGRIRKNGHRFFGFSFVWRTAFVLFLYTGLCADRNG